jgi:hypothetical protein
MLGWRSLSALAFMAVASGAALPWVMPSHSPEPVASQANTTLAPLRAGAGIAAAAAVTAPLRGTIAIGDEPVAGATQCLKSRGIDVHPQPADTAEDLLAMVSRASRDYAVVVIHTGHREGLVDGQIDRVIDAVGSPRRVVWATIRLPYGGTGGFSFEDRTNASIRNVVDRHPEGRVLDWHAMTSKHPEWTLDGLNLSEQGCREYARKVAKLSGLPRGT